MKFALEHQNPLVTDWIRGGGTLPNSTYSLLSISNPDVLLWALKPAEDGASKRLISGVWNLSAKPQEYSLTLATGIAGATKTTHIETDLEPLTISRNAVTV